MDDTEAAIFEALDHDDNAIRLEALKKCINENSDWENSYDSDGISPLMSAAMSGFHECVSVMIEAGADVDKCDSTDDTALMYCFRADKNTNPNNRLKCVRLLLDAGADIYQEDRYGCSPLMAACSICAVECVSEILKRGYPSKLNQNGTEIHKSDKFENSSKEVEAAFKDDENMLKRGFGRAVDEKESENRKPMGVECLSKDEQSAAEACEDSPNDHTAASKAFEDSDKDAGAACTAYKGGSVDGRDTYSQNIRMEGTPKVDRSSSFASSSESNVSFDESDNRGENIVITPNDDETASKAFEDSNNDDEAACAAYKGGSVNGGDTNTQNTRTEGKPKVDRNSSSASSSESNVSFDESDINSKNTRTEEKPNVGRSPSSASSPESNFSFDESDNINENIVITPTPSSPVSSLEPSSPEQFDRTDINVSDGAECRNALHHCLNSDNRGPDQVACLKLLLDAGADPTIKEGYYRTMQLAITSVTNSISLVKILLAAGAPFKPAEDFLEAITVFNPELMPLFLQLGADVNHRYKYGYTALINLVDAIPRDLPRNTERDERVKKCLKILLAANPDINASDSRGLQPIHFALVLWSCFKFPTEYLISENCDFSRLSFSNVCAVFYSDFRDNCKDLMDIIQILYDCGLSYPLCQSFSDAAWDVEDYVDKLTCSPRRLFTLCTISVRQHLGQGIKWKCEELPIPKTVKDLILLKDILSPECFE